jgi:hypothetical protein
MIDPVSRRAEREQLRRDTDELIAILDARIAHVRLHGPTEVLPHLEGLRARMVSSLETLTDELTPQPEPSLRVTTPSTE